MNKTVQVYRQLITPRLFVAIFALIIVLHVLCLGRYPAIGGDEVVNASSALNLVRQGILARPIHHGSGFPIVDCMGTISYFGRGCGSCVSADFALAADCGRATGRC